MPKNWDSICLPKSVGGLGFRRMHDSNRALIAKNTWNIISAKKSLSTQLLTAKYLGIQNFLNSDPNTNNSSWIWRDIWSIKDLILKGACFHISINYAVRIWDDPWIPNLDNFKPTPLNPISLVRSPMLPNSASWNISTIV